MGCQLYLWERYEKVSFEFPNTLLSSQMPCNDAYRSIFFRPAMWFLGEKVQSSALRWYGNLKPDGSWGLMELQCGQWEGIARSMSRLSFRASESATGYH